MKKQNRTELYAYALLWGIAFAAPILSLYLRSVQDADIPFSWDSVFFVWQKYVLYLCIFLVHNFLLAPLLIYRQRRLLYSSVTALLLAIFTLYQCTNRPERPFEGPRPAFEETLGPPDIPHDEGFFDEERPPRPERDRHDPRDHNPPIVVGEHDIVSIIVLILLLGMNLGVKLYFKQGEDQKVLAELERNNLEQQLEYLKYQINPHFLMNTLNNIHALVDIDPEEAKLMIVELSKMLRFMLYEGAKQKVPLERELTFMQNYITLMKLRYTDKVNISVTLPDSIPNIEVPPLLFITFVENAFKHGVSYQQQSFISISVGIQADKLHFSCANSRVPGDEDEHGGVGLKNVKQRLELLYGSRYDLSIDDSPEQYTVKLDIPL